MPQPSCLLPFQPSHILPHIDPSPRILVIEDDPAIRRGLLDALRFESFTPFEAADAKSGLTLP